MSPRTATSILTLLLTLSSLCCRPAPKHDRDKALAALKSRVDSMQLTVLSLTGIRERRPVDVQILTRAELGRLFDSLTEIEFPNGSLQKRGECFAEMGVLPRGYDLTTGFVDLLKEQAGGAYNPHSKTFIGVLDLYTEKKRTVSDQMIISHELTHALQDRVIDIERQSEMGLENIDYEYSVRALIEGMASGVMVAHAQHCAFERLPDLQMFWRSQLSRAAGGAFGRAPHYVREYLMSPYAEGGRFIQSWLSAHPGKPLADLLGEIPSSSEQVLHFEKYAERDEPTTITLSGTRRRLPKSWRLYYANTLGEFDMWQLFQICPETKADAAVLAAGWDGCRFEAHKDAAGKLILVGASAWDSENDAREFCEGFRRVLEAIHHDRDFDVAQHESHVTFVVGSADGNLRSTILEALQR